MAIHLALLGGLRAVRDDLELDWLLGQRMRAAVLVYLSVERRVSRESLAAVFWPESRDENARHALRQSLYHLRKSLGGDWLEAGPHELRVRPGLATDVDAFLRAHDQGDLESAVQRYTGPFLHGVNLVDLEPWERWVDARRAQYARCFRSACRDLLSARRSAGDLAGGIDTARRWVAQDPWDDEAQHELITILNDAGERGEAIRQYEAYARILGSEGLRPLDATIEQIERLRAGAAMPSPPPVPVQGPAHPGPPSTGAGAAAGAVAPERAPTGSTRRSARRQWRPLLAAGLGVLLFAVAATVRSVSRESPAPATALAGTAVAVLPFSVRGSDEVQYLGDGIVTLLGTALDGAGPLRMVDPRAMLGMYAQEAGALSKLERGRRISGRLGARLFILGDIVHAGDRLHIEAAVHDANQAGRPRARAAVSGNAETFFDLANELAALLLADLRDGPGDRLTRSAAATASLPAFRAYLEGESQLRAGHFERAADSFSQALAHDSTFAIAHYRLALARDWAGEALPVEGSVASALRHADRLAPRDRALIEAFQAYLRADALEAERRYRTILSRHPDDLEAWYQLAEVLFHYGPLRGRSVAESEEAWRMVLSYEPRNLGAIMHFARSAAVDGRVEVIDSLLAPFAREEIEGDRRLIHAALLRAVAAGTLHGADRLVGEIQSWEESAMWQFAGYLTGFTHRPDVARDVLRQLLAPHRGPAVTSEIHWYLALLHLANGQWVEARAAHRDAVAAKPGGPKKWHRETFQLVSEWWLATLPLPYPDTLLQSVRRTAETIALPHREGEDDSNQDWRFAEYPWLETLGVPGTLEALRDYTIGTLSLRLGDRDGAAAAARALEDLASSGQSDALVRDLDRGLRARIAWKNGDPEGGIRILDALEFGPASLGATNVVPFVARAHERFLRGELLAESGRPEEALPWFRSLAELSMPESPYRALAHLRQAQLHERMGNRDQAAEHQARLVELWRDSDPEFHQVLAAARAR